MPVILKLLLLIYRPKQLKFGVWSKLEERMAHGGTLKILPFEFTKIFFDYINATTKIPYWVLKKLRWQYVLLLYSVCKDVNQPRKIPMLSSTQKGEEVDWDYVGRKYYVWVNLLAGEYGWSVDYIDNLEIDVVMSLAMEIVVDQQLKREFTWTTTEVAYVYEKSTGKSNYKPLPRPQFMQPKPKPIKKVLMKPETIPMGVVHDLGGMLDYVEKRIQTQAPNPQ